jgi:ankyrin repeat protein
MLSGLDNGRPRGAIPLSSFRYIGNWPSRCRQSTLATRPKSSAGGRCRTPGILPGFFGSERHHTILWACDKGHKALASMLMISTDMDVNQRDLGSRSTLSLAAENGHEAVVSVLLAADGTDVDLKDKNLRTPLIYAAKRGHNAIVQLLLDKGAYIEATHSLTMGGSQRDRGNCTATTR